MAKILTMSGEEADNTVSIPEIIEELSRLGHFTLLEEYCPCQRLTVSLIMQLCTRDMQLYHCEAQDIPAGELNDYKHRMLTIFRKEVPNAKDTGTAKVH